jgi:hypothetical protein
MKRNFVFIVMCACVFFTTQCGNGNDMEIALPEIPVEPKELPKDSPPDWSGYAELYERVKCPSSVKTGEEEDPVGIWKLILRINGTDTVDCSCEEVVYHFKSDQTLAVSIGNGAEENVVYEYDGFPFCPVCLPLTPRPNLRMGSSEVYCQVLPEIMFVYPQFEKVDVKVDQEREVLALLPLFEIKLIFIRIN